MSVYVKHRKGMEMKGKKKRKKEREICLASQEQSSKCKPFFGFGSNLSEERSSKTSLYICFLLKNLLSIPESERKRKRKRNFLLLL